MYTYHAYTFKGYFNSILNRLLSAERSVLESGRNALVGFEASEIYEFAVWKVRQPELIRY